MKIKKKTLALLRKDMQILNCEEQSCYVGGDRVVVDVVRSYFGKNSTGSIYTATAYDDYGNVISQSTGYFLEPRYDPAKERISGSDTAIANGSYNVIPTTFKGKTGYYELSGVPGRSGIKIHEGNTGKDTCGCPLPGSGIQECGKDDYMVIESKKQRDELFALFKQHGNSGIVMNITTKKDH